MRRFILLSCFLLTALPGAGQNVVLRALPVDEEEAYEAIRPQISAADHAKLPPAASTPQGEDAVRVQIYLDQSMFGPGVIDGKPGQFTQLAVAAWNEVHGHPAGSWEAVVTAARIGVQTPFATALVPDSSKDWIDVTLPTKRSEQAKRKRMSYRSAGEFMAERYHTDVPFLIELNGESKIRNLKPHDTITVPNVLPFLIETVGGKKFEKDEKLSQRHVVVDTKMNQVRIFEGTPTAMVVEDPDADVAPVANKNLIASFPITPGKPQFIKYGIWELRNQVELPWWRYDQSLLDTGKRSDNALNIPPGPNSPVGIIWCGTSKPGIGMHGTADPETIGRARSAGCVRLANWDAIRLPGLMRPGASVEIR